LDDDYTKKNEAAEVEIYDNELPELDRPQGPCKEHEEATVGDEKLKTKGVAY